MLFNRSIYGLVLLLLSSSIHSQQLQWILLSEGTSMDTPLARRDAALGFDGNYLLLFGGRGQTGTPLQDTYSFNVLTGQWDPITFPAPPSARYGMASANAMAGGLYIFGGFGIQSASTPNNPYAAFGSGRQDINYNYATPPNFIQNPILMNNPDFVNNPNYNPMSGTGYNNIHNNNDERIDEMFYPLEDAWFLNYMSKAWEQTQTSQYARGFGSAATSPYGSGTPRVIYSMGKSRSGMYSIVETIGPGTSGLSQTGATQSAMIMYDLSSFSPAYPHARYGHSTALLTDNYLLLFGGCLSGYGKGGPCPSKDSWLLHIDRGHWERLGECPTTKTGASMIALPSASTCASMGQGGNGASMSMSGGDEPAVAVLWSGLERNPSSIRTYPSPRDEVAVFDLSKKEWSLKRAAPSPTDGSYPMQREGAAFVAGCFDGSPGMFVFGGRGTADRRILSDLWFLRASPQDAVNAPGTRSCIYPFSFYHLHGIFQFFTYGVIFPFGYLVGRHAGNLAVKRPLHMILQIFGVALAICGFAFGVHSVRAPAWLHFKHAHAIIGIITFILTIFQFVVGLVGAFLLKKRPANSKHLHPSDQKLSQEDLPRDRWAGEGAWRLIHRILGFIVLILGLVNICLGVFLAVLPLPVWVTWYVYFGILVLILIGLEILAILRDISARKKGSLQSTVKREDPKGTSQASLKYTEEPTQATTNPITRRSFGRPPPLEPATRDGSLNRRGGGSIGEDRAPLLPTQIPSRQPRPGDVSTAASLPAYQRSTDREYPIPARKKSGPGDSGDAGYYVGYAPEHEQALPRPTTQQQSEHNLTRVRLQ